MEMPLESLIDEIVERSIENISHHKGAQSWETLIATSDGSGRVRVDRALPPNPPCDFMITVTMKGFHRG